MCRSRIAAQRRRPPKGSRRRRPPARPRRPQRVSRRTAAPARRRAGPGRSGRTGRSERRPSGARARRRRRRAPRGRARPRATSPARRAGRTGTPLRRRPGPSRPRTGCSGCRRRRRGATRRATPTRRAHSPRPAKRPAPKRAVHVACDQHPERQPAVGSGGRAFGERSRAAMRVGLSSRPDKPAGPHRLARRAEARVGSYQRFMSIRPPASRPPKGRTWNPATSGSSPCATL